MVTSPYHSFLQSDSNAIATVLTEIFSANPARTAPRTTNGFGHSFGIGANKGLPAASAEV
jgi:hypothetical protein